MKVLHLLSSCGIGGIEVLCKDYGCFSEHKNVFVSLWETDGPIAKEMKENGSNLVELNQSKKNYISTFKKLRLICKNEKIDVVIAQHSDPITFIYLILLKRKFPQIKTAVYVHSNAADMCRSNRKKLASAKKALLKKAAKASDRVIAISNSVKNSVIDILQVPERKISVVYNGANVDRFRAQAHPFATPVNIIYVGRLIEEKGVQVTLTALAKIKKETGADFRFRIVGDGSYRSALEAKAKELELGDSVEFLGKRRDIPNLLSESDIFIHMPVWEEGFGITIVEAMASGLVCVCAKSGAIPEIIDDCETGFLVEMGNPDELAERIEKIISEDRSEIMRIKENARRRADDFSIQTFATKLDETITSLS